MTTGSANDVAFSAAVYGEIFASSAVGLALWRDEGLIEEANATLAQLVGATRADELIGVGLSSCFSEMYRPRITDSLNRAVRTQGSSVVEAEVPHGKDNRLLLVTNIATTSRPGGISLIIDLTASLTALALASSPADNASAVNRLNATLAHEINNPLAYAMGNLSFAIDSLQGATDRRADLPTVVLALRDALEGAERVRRTVRELRRSGQRGVSPPMHGSDIPAPEQGALGQTTPPVTTSRPPALSDASLAFAPAAEAGEGASSAADALSGRILVVDAEPRIGSAIARVLTPLHDVTAVYTLRDALLRLQGGDQFDVILSDVSMPEASGGEFYRAVASAYPHMAPRVVFMTGGRFSDPANALLGSLVNARLEKPFSPGALRTIVRRALAAQTWPT